MSDKVLLLLEPYHLGRGEVDKQGLVFEVKAWTLLQLRNKCVQPLAVFGRLFLRGSQTYIAQRR